MYKEPGTFERICKRIINTNKNIRYLVTFGQYQIKRVKMLAWEIKTRCLNLSKI